MSLAIRWPSWFIPRSPHVPGFSAYFSQGVISVSKTTDGSLKGYISKRLGFQNAYTLTTDLEIADFFIPFG